METLLLLLLVYVTRLKRDISGRFECLLSPAFPAAGCILHVHAHAFPGRVTRSHVHTREHVACLRVQGQRFAQVATKRGREGGGEKEGGTFPRSSFELSKPPEREIPSALAKFCELRETKI